MSSKFFTWTKGDRRGLPETPRSNGIIPIPAEYISIKGVDHGRGRRVNPFALLSSAPFADCLRKHLRRPLPLFFDHSPEPLSKPIRKSDDSIALHEATIKSATSLMYVVNDILQSPQVSAHLAATQWNGLPHWQGRPRARTAPPTPLVEAPLSEPVELPGSLDAETPSITQPKGSNRRPELTPPPSQWQYPSLAAGIQRPHSSPQEPTGDVFTAHMAARTSGEGNLTLPFSLLPGPRSDSPSVRGDHHRTLSQSNAKLASVASCHASGNRPSLSVLQAWPASSPSIGSLRTISDSSSLQPQSLATSQPENVSLPTSPGITYKADDRVAACMEQMRTMRAAHDAHIVSLRDTHEKELQSHRSYIAFLETQRGALPTRSPSKIPLRLDTFRAQSRDTSHTPDASAATLGSLDTLRSQQRASQVPASAEAEALKRKLSLARREHVDSAEVRRERDSLREAADRSERRIAQLKDIVRKFKDQEKQLKNDLLDLQARLVAANNERTDVLEGFHEASQRLQVLARRQEEAQKEAEDLRSRLFYASGRHASDTTLALPDSNTMCRPKHHRTRSDIAGMALGGNRDAAHIAELRQLVHEKDELIQRLQRQALEHDDPPPTSVEEKTATARRVLQLETVLHDQRQLLAAARADCERYNSLLHNELRRQTRQAAANNEQRVHTPELHGDPIRQTIEESRRIIATLEGKQPEIARAQLEREVEHCLKEIVLYKLDVRGYKKDLKRAQAQIAELQHSAASAQRPPTPDRDSIGSAAGSTASSGSRPCSGRDVALSPSGLGISLQHPPPTPPAIQAPASVASSAPASSMPAMPMSPPPALPSMPTSPPLAPPKTPLSMHKKLPRPPPRTPSPLPNQIRRAETQRSVSESIVSSYMYRRTPPVEGGEKSGLTPSSSGT